MDSLTRYLPQTIVQHVTSDVQFCTNLEWTSNRDTAVKDLSSPMTQEVEGAVLFADITGFTSITEYMNQCGGTDEGLANTLNQYFQLLIRTISQHQGIIMRFLGDAILVIFVPDTENPAHPAKEDMGSLVRRAAECALGIKAELSGFRVQEKDTIQEISTTQPQPESFLSQDQILMQSSRSSQPTTEVKLELDIKIGIGVGKMTVIHVDAGFSRMEYILTGQPLVQCFLAENMVKNPRGKPSVVSSPEAWEFIYKYFNHAHQASDPRWEKLQTSSVSTTSGSTSHSDAISLASGIQQQRNFIFLESCHTTRRQEFKKGDKNMTLNLRPQYTYTDASKAMMQRYLPQSVIPWVESGQERFLNELREVTVLFISTGLPEAQMVSQGSLTHLLLVRQVLMSVQSAVVYFGGEINKFMLDDKGSTVIAVFGLPPKAHENDALRGVFAALSIVYSLRQLQINKEHLYPSIGITTGRAFCGGVGSMKRKEYTVLGDSVNLSARFMQKAKELQNLLSSADRHTNVPIICDGATASLASSLAFQPVDSILVKGKSQPVDAYRPFAIGLNRLYPTLGLSPDQLIRPPAALLSCGFVMPLHPSFYTSSQHWQRTQTTKTSGQNFFQPRNSIVLDTMPQIFSQQASQTNSNRHIIPSSGNNLLIGTTSSAIGSSSPSFHAISPNAASTGNDYTISLSQSRLQNLTRELNQINYAAQHNKFVVISRLLPTSPMIGALQGVFSLNIQDQYSAFGGDVISLNTAPNPIISGMPPQIVLSQSAATQSHTSMNSISSNSHSQMNLLQPPPSSSLSNRPSGNTLISSSSDSDSITFHNTMHSLNQNPSSSSAIEHKTTAPQFHLSQAPFREVLLVLALGSENSKSTQFLNPPYATSPFAIQLNPGEEPTLSPVQISGEYDLAVNDVSEHPVLLFPLNDSNFQTSSSDKLPTLQQFRPTTGKDGARSAGVAATTDYQLTIRSQPPIGPKNSVSVESKQMPDMGHKAAYLATPLQYLTAFNFLRTIPYYLARNKFHFEQVLRDQSNDPNTTTNNLNKNQNQSHYINSESDATCPSELDASELDDEYTLSSINNRIPKDHDYHSTPDTPTALMKNNNNGIFVNNDFDTSKNTPHISTTPAKSRKPTHFVYTDDAKGLPRSDMSSLQSINNHYFSTSPGLLSSENSIICPVMSSPPLPLHTNFPTLQRVAIYLSPELLDTINPKPYSLINSPFIQIIPPQAVMGSSSLVPRAKGTNGEYIHFSVEELIKFDIDSVGKLIALTAHYLNVPASMLGQTGGHNIRSNSTGLGSRGDDPRNNSHTDNIVDLPIRDRTSSTHIVSTYKTPNKFPALSSAAAVQLSPIAHISCYATYTQFDNASIKRLSAVNQLAGLRYKSAIHTQPLELQHCTPIDALVPLLQLQNSRAALIASQPRGSNGALSFLSNGLLSLQLDFVPGYQHSPMNQSDFGNFQQHHEQRYLAHARDRVVNLILTFLHRPVIPALTLQQQLQAHQQHHQQSQQQSLPPSSLRKPTNSHSKSSDSSNISNSTAQSSNNNTNSNSINNNSTLHNTNAAQFILRDFSDNTSTAISDSPSNNTVVNHALSPVFIPNNYVLTHQYSNEDTTSLTGSSVSSRPLDTNFAIPYEMLLQDDAFSLDESAAFISSDLDRKRRQQCAHNHKDSARRWNATNGSLDYVKNPLAHMMPQHMSSMTELPRRTKGLVVLIEGAPGLGKSLLLHTIKNESITPVVQATASPLDARPYSLIGSLVWQLLEQEVAVYETLFKNIVTFYGPSGPTILEPNHLDTPRSTDRNLRNTYTNSTPNTSFINPNAPLVSMFSPPDDLPASTPLKTHNPFISSQTPPSFAPSAPDPLSSQFLPSDFTSCLNGVPPPPPSRSSSKYPQFTPSIPSQTMPSSGPKQRGDSIAIQQQMIPPPPAKASQSIGAHSSTQRTPDLAPIEQFPTTESTLQPLPTPTSQNYPTSFRPNSASLSQTSKNSYTHKMYASRLDSVPSSLANDITITTPTTPSCLLKHVPPSSLSKYEDVIALNMIYKATAVRQLVLAARLKQCFVETPQAITLPPHSWKLFQRVLTETNTHSTSFPNIPQQSLPSSRPPPLPVPQQSSTPHYTFSRTDVPQISISPFPASPPPLNSISTTPGSSGTIGTSGDYLPLLHPLFFQKSGDTNRNISLSPSPSTSNPNSLSKQRSSQYDSSPMHITPHMLQQISATRSHQHNLPTPLSQKQLLTDDDTLFNLISPQDNRLPMNQQPYILDGTNIHEFIPLLNLILPELELTNSPFTTALLDQYSPIFIPEVGYPIPLENKTPQQQYADAMQRFHHSKKIPPAIQQPYQIEEFTQYDYFMVIHEILKALLFTFFRFWSIHSPIPANFDIDSTKLHTQLLTTVINNNQIASGNTTLSPAMSTMVNATDSYLTVPSNRSQPHFQRDSNLALLQQHAAGIIGSSPPFIASNRIAVATSPPTIDPVTPIQAPINSSYNFNCNAHLDIITQHFALYQDLRLPCTNRINISTLPPPPSLVKAHVQFLPKDAHLHPDNRYGAAGQPPLLQQQSILNESNNMSALNTPNKSTIRHTRTTSELGHSIFSSDNEQPHSNTPSHTLQSRHTPLPLQILNQDFQQNNNNAIQPFQPLQPQRITSNTNNSNNNTSNKLRDPNNDTEHKQAGSVPTHGLTLMIDRASGLDEYSWSLLSALPAAVPNSILIITSRPLDRYSADSVQAGVSSAKDYSPPPGYLHLSNDPQTCHIRLGPRHQFTWQSLFAHVLLNMAIKQQVTGLEQFARVKDATGSSANNALTFGGPRPTPLDLNPENLHSIRGLPTSTASNGGPNTFLSPSSTMPHLLSSSSTLAHLHHQSFSTLLSPTSSSLNSTVNPQIAQIQALLAPRQVTINCPYTQKAADGAQYESIGMAVTAFDINLGSQASFARDLPSPLLYFLSTLDGNPQLIRECPSLLKTLGYLRFVQNFTKLQFTNLLANTDPSLSFPRIKLSLPIAPHIRALLAALCDRISPSQMLILKVATLIGHVFNFNLLLRAFPLFENGNHRELCLTTSKKVTKAAIVHKDFQSLVRLGVIECIPQNSARHLQLLKVQPYVQDSLYQDSVLALQGYSQSKLNRFFVETALDPTKFNPTHLKTQNKSSSHQSVQITEQHVIAHQAKVQPYEIRKQPVEYLYRFRQGFLRDYLHQRTLSEHKIALENALQLANDEINYIDVENTLPVTPVPITLRQTKLGVVAISHEDARATPVCFYAQNKLLNERQHLQIMKDQPAIAEFDILIHSNPYGKIELHAHVSSLKHRIMDLQFDDAHFQSASTISQLPPDLQGQFLSSTNWKERYFALHQHAITVWNTIQDFAAFTAHVLIQEFLIHQLQLHEKQYALHNIDATARTNTIKALTTPTTMNLNELLTFSRQNIISQGNSENLEFDDLLTAFLQSAAQSVPYSSSMRNSSSDDNGRGMCETSSQPLYQQFAAFDNGQVDYSTLDIRDFPVLLDRFLLQPVAVIPLTNARISNVEVVQLPPDWFQTNDEQRLYQAQAGTSVVLAGTPTNAGLLSNQLPSVIEQSFDVDETQEEPIATTVVTLSATTWSKSGNLFNHKSLNHFSLMFRPHDIYAISPGDADQFLSLFEALKPRSTAFITAETSKTRFRDSVRNLIIQDKNSPSLDPKEKQDIEGDFLHTIKNGTTSNVLMTTTCWCYKHEGGILSSRWKERRIVLFNNGLQFRYAEPTSTKAPVKPIPKEKEDPKSKSSTLASSHTPTQSSASFSDNKSRHNHNVPVTNDPYDNSLELKNDSWTIDLQSHSSQNTGPLAKDLAQAPLQVASLGVGVQMLRPPENKYKGKQFHLELSVEMWYKKGAVKWSPRVFVLAFNTAPERDRLESILRLLICTNTIDWLMKKHLATITDCAKSFSYLLDISNSAAGGQDNKGRNNYFTMRGRTASMVVTPTMSRNSLGSTPSMSSMKYDKFPPPLPSMTSPQITSIASRRASVASTSKELPSGFLPLVDLHQPPHQSPLQQVLPTQKSSISIHYYTESWNNEQVSIQNIFGHHHDTKSLPKILTTPELAPKDETHSPTCSCPMHPRPVRFQPIKSLSFSLLNTPPHSFTQSPDRDRDRVAPADGLVIEVIDHQTDEFISERNKHLPVRIGLLSSDGDDSDDDSLSDLNSLSLESLCRPSPSDDEDYYYQKAQKQFAAQQPPTPRVEAPPVAPTPLELPDTLTVCNVCGHLSIHSILCPHYTSILDDYLQHQQDSLYLRRDDFLKRHSSLPPLQTTSGQPHRSESHGHDDESNESDEEDVSARSRTRSSRREVRRSSQDQINIDGGKFVPFTKSQYKNQNSDIQEHDEDDDDDDDDDGSSQDHDEYYDEYFDDQTNRLKNNNENTASKPLRNTKRRRTKLLLAHLHQQVVRQQRKKLQQEHQQRVRRNNLITRVLKETATLVSHAQTLSDHLQTQVDLLNIEMASKAHPAPVIGAIVEIEESVKVLKNEIVTAVKNIPTILDEHGLIGLLHYTDCNFHQAIQSSTLTKYKDKASFLTSLTQQLNEQHQQLEIDLLPPLSAPEKSSSRGRNPVQTQQPQGRSSSMMRRQRQSVSPVRPFPLQKTSNAIPAQINSPTTPILLENATNNIEQRRLRVSSRPPSKNRPSESTSPLINIATSPPTTIGTLPNGSKRDVSTHSKRVTGSVSSNSTLPHPNSARDDEPISVDGETIHTNPRPTTPTTSQISRTSKQSRRATKARIHTSQPDIHSQTDAIPKDNSQTDHTVQSNQSTTQQSTQPTTTTTTTIKSFGAAGLEAPYQAWLLSQYTQELTQHQDNNNNSPRNNESILQTQSHSDDVTSPDQSNPGLDSAPAPTDVASIANLSLSAHSTGKHDDVDGPQDPVPTIAPSQATSTGGNNDDNASQTHDVALDTSLLPGINMNNSNEICADLATLSTHQRPKKSLADLILDPISAISVSFPHDQMYFIVLEGTKNLIADSHAIWESDYEAFLKREQEVIARHQQETTLYVPNSIDPQQSTTPTSSTAGGPPQRLPKPESLPLWHHGIAAPILTWAYNTFDEDPAVLLLNIVRMLASFDIPHQFQIDPTKLANFLCAVWHCYRDNPYHSARHAMDVTLTVWSFLTLGQAAQLMTNLERFALIIASFCHDIDHPLINNAYCSTTRNSFSQIANDQSVLEYHHSRVTWIILQRAECNILSKLTRNEHAEFRKISLLSILATDMTQHFNFVDRFSKLMSQLEDFRTNAPTHLALTAELYNSQQDFLNWLQVQHNAGLLSPQQSGLIAQSSGYSTGLTRHDSSTLIPMPNLQRPSSSTTPTQIQASFGPRRGPNIHIGPSITQPPLLTHGTLSPCVNITGNEKQSSPDHYFPTLIPASESTNRRLTRRASVVLTPSRENCIIQVAVMGSDNGDNNSTRQHNHIHNHNHQGHYSLPIPIQLNHSSSQTRSAGHSTVHFDQSTGSLIPSPLMLQQTDVLTQHHLEHYHSLQSSQHIQNLQLNSSTHPIFTFYNSNLPLTNDLPLYAFVRRISFTDRVLIIQMLLHAADISNPTKPWRESKRWADAVCNEFGIQGDLEQYYGFPISPNCNRRETNLAMINVSFIDYVVAPLFFSLQRLLPDMSILCRRMSSNRNTWCALYTTFIDSTLARLNAIYTLKQLHIHYSTQSNSTNISEEPFIRPSIPFVTDSSIDFSTISLTEEENIHFGQTIFPFVAPPVPAPPSDESLSEVFTRLAHPSLLPSRDLIRDKVSYTYQAGQTICVVPSGDTTNPTTTTSQLVFALPGATVNVDRDYWKQENQRWSLRKQTFHDKYHKDDQELITSGDERLISLLQEDYNVFTFQLQSILDEQCDEIEQKVDKDDSTINNNKNKNTAIINDNNTNNNNCTNHTGPALQVLEIETQIFNTPTITTTEPVTPKTSTNIIVSPAHVHIEIPVSPLAVSPTILTPQQSPILHSTPASALLTQNPPVDTASSSTDPISQQNSPPATQHKSKKDKSPSQTVKSPPETQNSTANVPPTTTSTVKSPTPSSSDKKLKADAKGSKKKNKK